MRIMDRNSLLTRPVFNKERVEIGEGTGRFVYIKELSAGERDSYFSSMYKFNPDIKVSNTKNNLDNMGKVNADMTNYRASLVVRCMCDEHGNLLLNENDIEEFSNCVSSAIMDTLYNTALKLNGMQVAVDEENVEEKEKN